MTILQPCHELCAYEGEPLAECNAHSRADYTTDCHSDIHMLYRNLAISTFVVMVAGIPTYLSYVLRKNAAAIRRVVTCARMKTHAEPKDCTWQIRGLSMIFESYTDDCYYWEVVELLRKASLTGFVLFLDQGSVQQTLFGLLTSIFFVWFTEHSKPYYDVADHNLQQACLVTITLVMVAGVMLRTLHYETEAGNFLPESLEEQRNIIGTLLLTVFLSLMLVSPSPILRYPACTHRLRLSLVVRICFPFHVLTKAWPVCIVESSHGSVLGVEAYDQDD